MEQNLCTDHRYLRHMNKGKKLNLNLKYVTIIDHVTGWSEITQYDYKHAISVEKLVDTTWLDRYPRPMGIGYEQGLEFIGHEFKKSLIE